MNLVRLDGSPALIGQYMVDTTTSRDGQGSFEHFVASGRQTIPLTGLRDLEPGNILGTESHPLLRVPLEILESHDTQHVVTTVAESTVTLHPPYRRERHDRCLWRPSNITLPSARRCPTRVIRQPLEYGTLSHSAD